MSFPGGNLACCFHGFHLIQERLFSFLLLSSLPLILFPCFFSFFLDSLIGFPVLDNFGGDSGDGLLKVRFLQLALPNDDDTPSFRLQFTPYFLIPLLVSGNLCRPELGVGFGNRIIFTVFVAMPEATVYKDNRPMLLEHNIRFPGKGLFVYSIAKTVMPKSETNDQFGSRVLCTNP